MSTVREWFEAALQIEDEVKRAEAMCDLAFDAEHMARQGDPNAVELLELLVTLNPYDDLLHPAIESAEERLIQLGLRSVPPLDEIVAELHTQFGHMPERQRLVAVATTLTRGRSRYPARWSVALQLLNAAHALAPLTPKEARVRAEVQRRVAES